MSKQYHTQSGLAEINGANLYYDVQGSGPPLLLLHAGIADSRMWDAQMDAFSASYQVIRFDMRGFGQSNMPSGTFSNADDVKEILDFLGVKAAYVLGISFGGLVAVDFALTHPGYVKGLILGAPSVSGAKPSDRIKQFWDEEDTALENGDLEGATELNLRLWVDGPHRQPDQVDTALRTKMHTMQMEIFQKDIPDDIEEIDLDPPALERLGDINIPVQLIVGDLDLDEKIILVDKLAAELTISHKVVMPGVAHMLNMENPELFNHTVLDFLAKV
ncbi:MAG: alpha/beta hydrolase [Chloroflexota bacterium]